MPISAYQEVFDAYHRTGVGTDGDYRSILKAFLRCGLAFCFTGVVASNIGTDVLFGTGHRATSKINVGAQFDNFQKLYEALRDGRILGIVNMVGCSNPRVVYEQATVAVADVLLRNNVLILTNGCASFPLLKLGYCSKEGAQKAGESLRAFVQEYDVPPVWHVGECIDNTRSSGIFAGVAACAGQAIKDMPYGFASPEWSNEKGLDASLAFRLFGIDSYHCVEPPVQGSAVVEKFLKEDTKDMLGAVMTVNTNPEELGEKIVADMRIARQKLGWR